MQVRAHGEVGWDFRWDKSSFPEQMTYTYYVLTNKVIRLESSNQNTRHLELPVLVYCAKGDLHGQTAQLDTTQVIQISIVPARDPSRQGSLHSDHFRALRIAENVMMLILHH